VSRRLARGGVRAVTRARLLPLAPFTIVNLIAGASRVRMRDYLVGTAAGMVPGIVVFALFGDRLRHAVRARDASSFALLGGVAAGLIAIGLALHRYYARGAGTSTTRAVARGDMRFGVPVRPQHEARG